jgi:hypothetical protein
MRPQHLVVADLTTVIEGNYPMAGNLRQVGLLAGGTDAAAVDAVLAELVGVRPTELSYLRHASDRGFVWDSVDLRGEPLARAAFEIERAPVAARWLPRVFVHSETACGACRRWVAAALEQLHEELQSYPGEVTIIAGPRDRLPELRGAVVLVGNALYDHRHAGVYLEGCPPRAIQLAGIRFALGQNVTADQRSQFRVPSEGGFHPVPAMADLGDEV